MEDYIGFRLSYLEGDPHRPSGKLADERQAMTAFASWPLKAALLFLRDAALNGRPITLSADSRRTFLVFTDGSVEGDKAELGGVLFSQEGAPLSFYSMSLSSEVLARLRLDSKHPIYEVELLGTWIGLHLWQQKLKDSYAVFYIDNEAVKGSLIKQISNTRHGQTILSSFIELEEKTVCRGYFARAPTSANPADAPSRGQTDQPPCWRQGGTRVL